MLGQTPLNIGSFVTVDIESTGCRPGTSSIIEIGAVRIDAGTITGHFSRLVRPTDPIPPAIAHLTGITEEMVAGAPDIGQVMSEFREFLGDAVLIAHNHRFDMSFLDYEAEREWGAPFARPVLDTLTLARRLHPELPRHNLRDLAVFYGTEHAPAHRAHPDALATAEVFVRMIDELIADGELTAADVARVCGVAQESRLARKLALATHIPDSAGIYLFRDERRAVVYVGRAKSLRTRVRNHFYAPDDSAAPSPASEVASIQYFPLASALDAALLEVRLQDRYAPVFNRDGRQRRRPMYLHVDTTSELLRVRATHRRYRSGELLGPLSNEWAAHTIADAVSDFFGTRPCGCTPAKCASGECARHDAQLCGFPLAIDGGPEDSYAAGVRAALAIFDGDGGGFREVLRVMQERSAQAEQYEDAARYRDAIRALDRTLAALGTARRAAAEGVSVILEGDEQNATLVVVVHGWHFTTLRFRREQVESGAHLERLERSLERALRQLRTNPGITPRRLRDMAIIDAYRQQHDPLTVAADSDARSAASAVAAAIRRQMRVPKKRHGAASAG